MRSDLSIGGATPSAMEGFDLLADFRTLMGIDANLPGLTVKRIRGALQFNLTADPGATSGVLLGVHKGNVSGVAGLPSTDPSDDWMMFDWAPLTMGWAGGSADIPGGSFSYAMDVKSQRRLDEPQETIWLQVETTRTADTMSMYGWVSVLVALP